MSTCADRLLSRRPVVIALLLGWLLTAFAPPARAAGDCYSEYTWRQGQAKQQMMSDTEGTCVSPRWVATSRGAANGVRVYREEGFW